MELFDHRALRWLPRPRHCERQDARASRTRQRGSRHRGLCRPQSGRSNENPSLLALLQNFVRIQALKMALIGATIIMLTEGSSMAATITVHSRHETHRYDGRRPMIKLVVTALFAAIIVVLLALSARAQQIVHRNNRVLPPIEFDRP